MRSWLPVTCLGALVLCAAPADAQVTVTVDAAANRLPISPLIYGVHFANSPTLLDLNATVNRHGGNSVGRYNWQQNIDNRGSDWYFRAFGLDYSASPGGLGDDFITSTKAGGAEPFLSMPMVGWVAKTNVNRDDTWSFSQVKYGAFVDSLGDAGNGCKPGVPLDNYHPCGGLQQGGTAVPFTGNDPNDGSVPAGVDFQQGWMQHVVDTHGAANAGGLKYWGLDNEPSIWHAVYWDVHPQGASALDIRQKMIAYGSRIKAVDPGAQVLGPEEWGWDGFFYSGRDQQLWGRNQCSGLDCPDRVAIGGEYVPWLLGQMKQYEDENGTRILDMLTLHVYPQGGEVDNGGTDVSLAMQAKRNRSTRSLWDVNYVDESWIGTEVRLIPRMRAWVAGSYPGTKLGLTEYDWGAENHINGATAQADLLGIFGREGLDMAIRWVVPATNSHVYNAFKMYRNYDGARSTFGDTSVSTTVPNPDALSAFSAQRTADGALTVMVVNKGTSATSTTVNLANFSSNGTAQRWQMTSANTITQLTNVSVAGGSFTTSLPAQSITLFVLAPAPATPSLSIDDVTVAEADAGTRSITPTVSLSSASSQTVTVNYSTQNDTAAAGSDYVGVSNVPITFSPGQTTRTVTISVNGDTAFEGTERFFVNLTSPVNATIADGQGIATIVDDDSGLGSDFNGDGEQDILWQHQANGQILAWYMAGLSRTGHAWLNPSAVPDLGWKIVGTADFDADGDPDLLWQHQGNGTLVVWYMNGLTRSGYVFVNPTVPDLDWKIVGTGDFDGDGDPDLLWQHQGNGNLVVWYMNGVTRSSYAWLNPGVVSDLGWKVVGAADFNLDGKPDVLWQHQVSGALVVWYMNGVTRTSYAFPEPGAVTDTNWKVFASADFNRDGRPDILWQNRSSGLLVAWLMKGLSRQSFPVLSPGTVSDLGWKVVGPK